MDGRSNGALPATRIRIEAVDVARGVALLAMAIYHFTWDLEFFGYAERGLTAVGGWRLFARAIASSFLFLVGISLVLGHGDEFRPASFMRRLRQVVAAAVLISAVTWFIFPDGFIFFGILHQIAAASVIGLFFVRLPAFLTVLVAVLVIAAPHFLRNDFFNNPALWWVGLSTSIPRSNDYVPIFPWLGAALLGVAAARLAVDHGATARLAAIRPGGWSRPLILAGRHSLAVYLIHQPVLIALLFLFSQIVPAGEAQPTPQAFVQDCRAQCIAEQEEAFCSRYCACALDRVESAGQLEAVFSRSPDAATLDFMQGVVEICSVEALE